ncbi:M28 family metallopeptidase [Aridibaculum aurantiacum]|uniref:M28 family metallopeptidase n=1 Tax=Aridibaculum aurantiacum TaxID=2810307 RepID=UPI001F5FFED6|nr:M28 family peptidase [Aridibaculum aurantiacum]
MKKFLLFLLSLFSFTLSQAQEMVYARKLVDTLTSPYFWGRGYTKNGMAKAAEFIAAEMKELGLKPMSNKGYLQEFSFPVNAFPGKMEVSINGKLLTPGKDFIVSPDSRSVRTKTALQQNDSVTFLAAADRLLVTLEDKLTWSVAPAQADFTHVMIAKKVLDQKPENISINVDAKLFNSFSASNVCGLVKGTTQPDSLIVFTAHYDHLGGLGSDTYFPGANDNASGISLLLNLAKYYAANPQPYSMAFIAFAGEEAGLVGSKFFTNNPLVPLNSIRFLINVDLVGTGEEGITVVNATEYVQEFAQLNKINDEYKLLQKINARGKAANSDHYWFSEKGVPAFFLYTLGGIAAYHDVHDKGATLPLTEFIDVMKLVIKFNEWLMGKH